MKFLTKVKVTLKDGVLDPQGQTIGNALNDLGFESIISVKSGKIFSVEVDAESEEKAKLIVSDAASKLLSNPIIEKFDVEVER
jgi:phosphoribosylformylglycinamidine synthase PurS subunit